MKLENGMKIKGWRFAEVGEDAKSAPGLYYNSQMVKYEGVIGTVMMVGEYDDDTFGIQFANDWWGYPVAEALDYIVVE